MAATTADDDDDGDDGDGGAALAALTAKTLRLPVSHEVLLRGHHKTVTCVAVDGAGARVATGGVDYRVKLYDFGGMDGRHAPFRDFAPDDGHALAALSWSPSGDRLLAVTGSAQPSVWTRDGKRLVRFVRGDMYVTDVVHEGPPPTCTGGEWHPHEKQRVLTSGLDGSLRLWDLNGKTGLRDELYCDAAVKLRDAKGGKADATSCAYSPDGGVVYAGAADGAVHAWSVRGRGSSYARPDASTRAAGAIAAACRDGQAARAGPAGHAAGAAVTCVRPSPDNRLVASRADDGRVCVWDVRKLRGPLCSYEVPTYHATASVAWSADGALLVAGTDVAKRVGVGALACRAAARDRARGRARRVRRGGGRAAARAAERADRRRARRVGRRGRVAPAHPAALLRDGRRRDARAVRPGPLAQRRAALGAARHRAAARGRRARRRLRRGRGHRRDRRAHDRQPARTADVRAGRQEAPYSMIRNDDKLSRRPEMPLNGPGMQGRSQGGGGAGTHATWYMNNMREKRVKNLRDQDPREELLKYADATKGAELTRGAYRATTRSGRSSRSAPPSRRRRTSSRSSASSSSREPAARQARESGAARA